MIIEQELLLELRTEIQDRVMHITDFNDDFISIDTTGAKQLIKLLQEFVNENQD